ncbi:anhydro-N-acetylmuramic acid kinase [Paenibacillus lemnae]|uniref:Anhydro-N-acetylmuramic acid kinase n=1 Tax=Paenibacillus lemnae TaxID=1330551 RepID=A0A848MA51_PAELE|nr:anhydro-N-acetylmuramic acid kinase [Paenibacillus lemnae]NMO97937.1 anhydro-N-acetylmuramic acid kinase [Paenibacillus lemnae]
MLSAWKNKDSAVVIGLMSGTSLDGIDAAVVQITSHGMDLESKLLHFETAPYTPDLREALKKLCSQDHSSSAAVCGMNAYLGEHFAAAAQKAAEGAGLKLEDIDLISSHGQTIWHIPERSAQDFFLIPSTLQIGDLSVIAKHTGRMTVGDFRPADMAVGGQGAPLVPFGDLMLFRHPEKGRLLQNIGGIGNCTAIPAGNTSGELLAFDTGPGNMIIDEMVQVLSGGKLSYDDGGVWAAQGNVHEGLVQDLMAHRYFQMAPPKSTGRELFGKSYAAAFMEQASHRGLSDADMIATATAFTACSIEASLRHHVFPVMHIDEVILSGGGARNHELCRMLQERLPEQKIMTSKALGIDEDAKEAAIFALLGYACLQGIPNNIPAATGAKTSTVMGKIALP